MCLTAYTSRASGTCRSPRSNVPTRISKNHRWKQTRVCNFEDLVTRLHAIARHVRLRDARGRKRLFQITSVARRYLTDLHTEPRSEPPWKLWKSRFRVFGKPLGLVSSFLEGKTLFEQCYDVSRNSKEQRSLMRTDVAFMDYGASGENIYIARKYEQFPAICVRANNTAGTITSVPFDKISSPL